MDAISILTTIAYKHHGRESNMLSQRIIEKVCNKVKDIVMEAESLIEGELNPQSASQVSEIHNDLASTIWLTAMKTQHG